MVNWKVVLVVIVAAILFMAIGMWVGYQYVSEQENISPEGWLETPETVFPRHNQSLVFAAVPAEIP